MLVFFKFKKIEFCLKEEDKLWAMALTKVLSKRFERKTLTVTIEVAAQSSTKFCVE